jgi:hypothetical protein
MELVDRIGAGASPTPAPVFLQNAEMKGLAGVLLQNAHSKGG